MFLLTRFFRLCVCMCVCVSVCVSVCLCLSVFFVCSDFSPSPFCSSFCETSNGAGGQQYCTSGSIQSHSPPLNPSILFLFMFSYKLKQISNVWALLEILRPRMHLQPTSSTLLPSALITRTGRATLLSTIYFGSSTTQTISIPTPSQLLTLMAVRYGLPFPCLPGLPYPWAPL